MEKRRLVIRADAGDRLGTGHVMRCLALAQAWQDHARPAIFATAAPTPALKIRLESEGTEVVKLAAAPGSAADARETAQLARQVGSPWVVVDGYHFGASYQKLIKESGASLLFLDDVGHCDYYFADLVLNQNLHASKSLYPRRAPYTRLLLGTRFVLLRREYRQLRGWRREIPGVARKVLVSLGGSDPLNQTLKVIRALKQVDLEGLKVTVVLGALNPHAQVLQTVARTLSLPPRLVQNIQDMPGLMAWADLAVTSGGTTVWELAFTGLPSLGLALGEQEEILLAAAANLGLMVNLGEAHTLEAPALATAITDLAQNQEQRASMSAKGHRQVDGYGAERVISMMKGGK